MWAKGLHRPRLKVVGTFYSTASMFDRTFLIALDSTVAGTTFMAECEALQRGASIALLADDIEDFDVNSFSYGRQVCLSSGTTGIQIVTKWSFDSACIKSK